MNAATAFEDEKGATPARVTNLRVSGMTCNNCARHVTEALQSVPGVRSAEVQLEEGSATVRWNGESPDSSQLLGALAEAGYPGEVVEPGGEAKPRNKWSPFEGWLFNVVVGLAVTLPMMVLEWGFGVGMERWYHWLSFILALPLQLLGGGKFYRGAWAQLKIGQSNMDTLVALGSTTAFLYSVWGLFAGWHSHLFFMDAAAIITLVSVGHYLESKASAQAASSLKALLNLSPEQARRLNDAGEEELVDVAKLRIGDRVALKPGDRAGTDGKVVQGASAVDESMLTGESMPVEKMPGANIYAGTVNQSGRLVLEVTATGESTALARIIEVVRRAQTSRANIQRLGDRVSSVFVPIVVVIALATALLWGLAPGAAAAAHNFLAQFLWKLNVPMEGIGAAVFHSAAVLIIACPCAMGLATPIAIMAGTNAAARRGILIRDGAALEKSGSITAVVFDKTGTLTEGKVSVAEVKDLASGPGLDTRAVAAALAALSNHPLSRAIAKLSVQPLLVENWKEHRGSGLEGTISGETFRMGSLKWAASNGVNIDPPEQWINQAFTVNALFRGQEPVGLIALKDAPKKNAGTVISSLRKDGKKIYLVTGDNRRTAEALAREVGLSAEDVFAEVRPEEKAEIVKKLQAAGEKVAFAGDGINDAPALEQADLGIALMNASDVARESADIVLLKAELEAIPEALGIARATLRTIKQNLFWAFFYNALGVPLAALGFLTPIFSALAMGLSDLFVVGNALRLRVWKR